MIQTPASATPVPGLTEALSDLGRLATLAKAQSAADTLRQRFGLEAAAPAKPTPATPAFAVGGKPVVELVDMRLLLAQIAVQTGAKDHLALARAQDEGVHQVILLHGGFVTLAGLAALMATSPAAGFVSTDAQGTTLTRALVVWSDAGLRLGPDDVLNLSRADGSFLANLGWLDIQGATLRGTVADNVREPAFRPFLLTAGRGSLTIRDASFAHLGFGDTQRFGGVAVDTTGLQAPRMSPVVTASRFDDVTTLTLMGTTSVTITANRMDGGAILIAHALKARIAGNLLTEAAGQAIRVSNASSDVVVADNIVLGALAGISADQASQHVTVTGNVLGGQSTSGIRLDKVDCVQVSGNLMALGSGTGVSLSNTGRVAIAGNAILDNSGAGILLRDQRDKASVRISGNQIAGNHEGLRGATAGTLTFLGNDMEGQLPRLFAGDLAPRTIAWLEDRRTHGPQALLTDPDPVCPAEGNI
jgi:hypothetical protein